MVNDLAPDIYLSGCLVLLSESSSLLKIFSGFSGWTMRREDLRKPRGYCSGEISSEHLTQVQAVHELFVFEHSMIWFQNSWPNCWKISYFGFIYLNFFQKKNWIKNFCSCLKQLMRCLEMCHLGTQALNLVRFLF